ncbi:ATP-dependent zinc protease [Lujinxingia vulgaris]|uniref:ATP-dependent zinc protease n=1 Tax=Lujinxingia vulgaris TaxID=2600176 RepID=A0A5C6X1E3_9DELT|nr:RimK/LysX family protein [Lujinxingia vulgaris]TXD32051.1 ATP-dependent zinc protease [Lujinxingia vulgaris]
MTEKKSPKAARPIIGWREWVGLPELGLGRIKAKIDTGARTSALHAENIELFERDGEPWVRFEVRPHQRSARDGAVAEYPLSDRRVVRSSSGHEEFRVVIRPVVEVLGQRFPIDLTLTNRKDMGFRMLLGRHAVRGRFLVDPAASFLGGNTSPR